MRIGRYRWANAVLTLCGFLLAKAPVCLKLSGFENPERVQRGCGAELAPPGRGYGALRRGTIPWWGGFRGQRVRFPRLLAAGLPLGSPPAGPGLLQRGRAAPAPPGTRRRSTRHHGAGPARPFATRSRRRDTAAAGLRFRDRMSLPQNVLSPRTGWSAPGRAHQPGRLAPRGSSAEGMAVGTEGGSRAAGLW